MEGLPSIGNYMGEKDLKSQIFKRKHDLKLESPGGWDWGSNQNTCHGRGMDILRNKISNTVGSVTSSKSFRSSSLCFTLSVTVVCCLITTTK